MPHSNINDANMSRRTAIGLAIGATALLTLNTAKAFAANEGEGSDAGEGGSGSVGVTDIFHDVVWYDPDPNNPPQGWNSDSTNWWLSLMTGGKQSIYSPSFTGIANTGQGFEYGWNTQMFRETCENALSIARQHFWNRADPIEKEHWGSVSNVDARVVAAALFTSCDRDTPTKPANYSWSGLHIADNWNESYNTHNIPSATAQHYHDTKSMHVLDSEAWNKKCKYDPSKTWYQFVRDNALAQSDDGKVWVCIIAVCKGQPESTGYLKIRKNVNI